MPIYGGVRDWEIAVSGVNVCLTDTAGCDPDQHFADSRFGKLNTLDLKRSTFFVYDSGCNFHCVMPPKCGSLFGSWGTFETILGTPGGVKEFCPLSTPLDFSRILAKEEWEGEGFFLDPSDCFPYTSSRKCDWTRSESMDDSHPRLGSPNGQSFS
jgi:hypothetical protein